MQPLRALKWSSFVLLLAIIACSLPLGPAAAPTIPVIPQVTATAAAAGPAATPTSAAPRIDPEKLKQGLDALLPSSMQTNNIFACSLAVVSPDPGSGQLQTSFFNYGALAKGSGTPVDSGTEYEIGSLTKLFTADLLALNVQNGQMKLDDPLQKYLPSTVHVPEYNGQAITLRELSTHTSGLPRSPANGGKVTNVNGVPMWGYIPDPEIFSFINTYQLTRAPGAKWEYSNLANGLLGIAEEQLAGTDYEKLVIAQIADPLGMHDTRITLSAEQTKGLAQGYETSGTRAPITATLGGTLAAGALRSSTHDMAIYLEHNIDPGSALPDTVFPMTQQRQDKGPTQTVVMGLGWLIANPGAADELFNKDGSTAGYNAYIAFSKTNRTGFVLLCNGHSINGLLAPIEKLLHLTGGAEDTNE